MNRLECLSIVSCELAQGVVKEEEKFGYKWGVVRQGFIFDLFKAFEKENISSSDQQIEIGKITAFDHSIFVTPTGNIYVHDLLNSEGLLNKPSQITMRSKNSEHKIIFTKSKEKDYVNYKRVLPETIDAQLRGGSLINPCSTSSTTRTKRSTTSSNACRFGTKTHFDLTEKEITLNGLISDSLAQNIKANIKAGPVLLANADNLILLAAMCPGPYEIIISDENLSKLFALQQAFRLATIKSNYTDWIASLNLSAGRRQFSQSVTTLFRGNSQAAFERLKARIEDNEIGFYQISLTKLVADDAFPNRRTNAAFTGIYLGAIEDQLKESLLQKTLDIRTRVSTALTQLETNLITLGSGSTQLHYHSLLETTSTKKALNPELKVKYATPSYLQAAKELVNNYPSVISQLIKTYKLADLFKRASFNLKNQNKQSDGSILSDHWMPILAGITYDLKTKTYHIPYIDSNNPQTATKILKTKRDDFIRIKKYSNQQVAALNQQYQLSAGKIPRPTYLKGMMRVDDFLDIIDIVKAFESWLNNGITIEGDSPLAKTLQAQVYLGMVSVGIGTVNSTSDAISLIKKGFQYKGYCTWEKYFTIIKSTYTLCQSCRKGLRSTRFTNFWSQCYTQCNCIIQC